MAAGSPRRLLAGLSMCLGFACSSTAQATAVAVIGADAPGEFVSSFLQGTGQFTSVTRIDQDSASLATLSAYDAVLFWSNTIVHDPIGLGNVLADYVDAGGGVVLATFSFYVTAVVLEGRIFSAGYSPFQSVQSSLYSNSTLGTYDASSPIMAGVNSLSGYFRDEVALAGGATLVASWADGNELAAYNHGGSVVGITLYPGESLGQGLGGDYARLFANSLVFAASAQAVPEPATYGLMAIGFAAVALARRRVRLAADC